MSDIFFSIAPVFLLIVIGNLIRRTIIPDMNFWSLCSKLVFWVLIPSLLFDKITSNDISVEVVHQYAIVILGGYFSVLVISLLAGFAFGYNRPTITSIVQGSVRHNAFIALAIVAKLFGNDGIVLATLLMAILVSVSNISIVLVMVLLLRDKSKSVGKTIFKETLSNPILITIFLSVWVSTSGIKHIPIISDMTHLLGDAGLPLVLLAIGANIRIKSIVVDTKPILLAVVIKLLIFPVITYILAIALGLTPLQITIAVLFGALPTAISSYPYAKQMGGDHQLASSIITIQTLLSFITIPVVLYALQ